MKKEILKQTLNVATVYGVTALSIVSTKAAGWIDDRDKVDGAMGADFRQDVVDIVNYALAFLGLLAVIFVIYGGFLMLTSGGEDDGISKGKKIIVGAAMGIVIILLSYGIVNVIVGAGGDTTT